MTLPVRHTTLALTLLAFTTACSAASPPAQVAEPAAAAPPQTTVTAEQKQAVYRQYAQMRQIEALGNRCDWLGPMEAAAVSASAEERHAWLVWQELDTVEATTQADALIGKIAQLDCDSSEGRELRVGAGHAAWQMRSSWALRGEAMLPGEGRPDWFQGKSNVAEHRAALDEAVAGLKAISKESAESSQAMFRQKAEEMLLVRCTAADRDCPAANADAELRAYSEQVIRQAEEFAQLLSQADDKTGRPPEPEDR